MHTVQSYVRCSKRIGNSTHKWDRAQSFVLYQDVPVVHPSEVEGELYYHWFLLLKSLKDPRSRDYAQAQPYHV